MLRFANGNSKLEPRGPDDVSSGPPTVVALGPADTYLRVGEERVPTNNQGMALRVEISSPAPVAGQPISFQTDAGIRCNELVIPVGQRAAEVPCRGLAQAAAAQVTAFIPERGEARTTVRVLGADEGPSAIAFVPPALTVAPGADARFTIEADLPATAAGLLILIEAPDFPGAPVELEMEAGTRTVELNLVAPEDVGEYTLTAFGADTLIEATVTVRAGPPLGADLVINEIDYDQPGNDGPEFVEIHNPTAAAIPLAGVRVEMVNGAGGAVYGTYNLVDAGQSLPAGGYLVIGGAGVVPPMGVLRMNLPANGLQNGAPDGVRLMRGNLRIDGLAYEGALEGTGEGMPAIADPGAGALARCPDGADGNDNATDFVLVDMPTPGAANACN